MTHRTVTVLTLGVALVGGVLTASADAQPLPSSACRFDVRLSPLVAPSRLDQSTRIRLVAQPDSPVVVTSVFYPLLMLPMSRPPSQVDLPFHISVMNVSDRLVRGVQLYVQLRSSAGLIGGGPKISRTLAPGEQVRMRSDGVFAGRLAAAATSDAHVLVAVESVEFADCVYRPSQAPQVFEKSTR